MPGRPPKAWWKRCMTDVKSHGGAVDPARVCGAVWARKSPAEKRAIVALEEGSAVSSKKKKGKKKSAAKKPKKAKKSGKRHGRCINCGHSHRGPCVHIKGGVLCPCNRPVHKRAA